MSNGSTVTVLMPDAVLEACCCSQESADANDARKGRSPTAGAEARNERRSGRRGRRRAKDTSPAGAPPLAYSSRHAAIDMIFAEIYRSAT